MATSNESKLKQLQDKHERAKKNLAIFRHQQKAEEKKADSRRKVLIGEAVVQAINDGKISEAFLGEILERYIVKERDREFLGLPTNTK